MGSDEDSDKPQNIQKRQLSKNLSDFSMFLQSLRLRFTLFCYPKLNEVILGDRLNILFVIWDMLFPVLQGIKKRIRNHS